MLKVSSGKLRDVELRIFQDDMTPAQLAALPAFAPPPDGRNWRMSEAAVVSILREEEPTSGVITIQDLLRDLGAPSVGYRGNSSRAFEA